LQEFLAAYRAHTKKVQKDIAMLRARVAEEEENLHRDEKVKRLQQDRDTFRAEVRAPHTRSGESTPAAGSLWDRGRWRSAADRSGAMVFRELGVGDVASSVS
jgi:hypothetical protein